MTRASVILDSITQLGDGACDFTVICASHGGAYVARIALARGVPALLVNDAGVGRDKAGIAALSLFEMHARPAAALDHGSARIGDGADCAGRGIVSFVNGPSFALGVRVGQTALEAAAFLSAAEAAPPVLLPGEDMRQVVAVGERGHVAIADSAGLVTTADEGALVVTGSHGGLLGGCRDSAIKAQVQAAVFNDAGGGIEEAGYSRLPVLAARGIAAATVSAWSARIGDARSTLNDGIISRLNQPALDLGCEVGMTVRGFVGLTMGISLGDV